MATDGTPQTGAVTLATQGGRRRPADPYRWMSDLDSPEMVSFLRAEYESSEEQTAHTRGLQDALFAECMARLDDVDESVPYQDHAHLYYSKLTKDTDYRVFYRRGILPGAKEEVILDQNDLARGTSHHSITQIELSPDGKSLAYLADEKGDGRLSLYIKDLSTAATIDHVKNVTATMAWVDEHTVYYVTDSADRRPCAVWRHTLGAGRRKDVKVFEEPDRSFDVSVSRARSGRFVFILAQSFNETEWLVLPTAVPTGAPRPFLRRRAGVQSRLEHGGTVFYLLTNENAPNFRVLRCADDGATLEEFVPHRPDVLVENLIAFDGFVVLVERVGGLRRFNIGGATGDHWRTLACLEPTYSVFPTENQQFNGTTFRYTTSSLRTPPTVIDFDVLSGASIVRKRSQPPTFSADRYVTEFISAPARDGKRIPVSLVKLRDQPAGPRPLLLYGYGAYGISVEPRFESDLLSLVDRGVTYAIAHVRGGQEMGRSWYEEGRLLNKQNTFNDFIDVAQHLVDAGHATRGRLVAHGASAGGMLVGVAANTRPDLFAAIVAEAPFVDVVNTLLDDSLPLSTQEWLQWGDPRDPIAYEYIRAYSPYDNVQRQAYPAMLVTGARRDSRVPCWEGAKWLARIRAARTNQLPLCLRISDAGSHFGASGRRQRIRDASFRYAFILDAMGLA
jgi:oligopeptidase B